MRELYEGGKTLKEVGVEVGVNHATVDKYLNSIGIKKRKQGRPKMSDESRLVMSYLRIKGWSYGRIAKHVGVSKQRVHQIIGPH